MIETIKDDEKRKQTDAKNEFSAYIFYLRFREETRNRTNEETNHMKI